MYKAESTADTGEEQGNIKIYHNRIAFDNIFWNENFPDLYLRTDIRRSCGDLNLRCLLILSVFLLQMSSLYLADLSLSQKVAVLVFLRVVSIISK